ncbi:MAG: response regulator [Chitinophagales bacterium]
MITTIKCLVVDDEELARILLETFIRRLPQLELVGKCKNAIEAIEVLQKQTVDLLFLDIQMPELTGIELLKTLQQKPLVIFTTAYSDYALEGYALDVTDYLLKPFSFQRFVQAVNKANEMLQLKATAQNVAANTKYPSTNLIPSNTEETGDTSKEKDYILVKSEHRVHRLKFDDIHYIQSMREYVSFYTNRVGSP